jgi:hypothetical protein
MRSRAAPKRLFNRRRRVSPPNPWKIKKPLALGAKSFVQGHLVGTEQAVDAFDLVVVDSFAIGMPLLIYGIVFPLHLFVQLDGFIAGSVQDGVQCRHLLVIQLDRAGKIGHVPLSKLLRTQLSWGGAGIPSGLHRIDGIEPVGKRPKHCPAEKHEERGKRGGES